MNEFPSILCPDSKTNFPKYRYELNLSNMRKEIFDLVICGDENSYFDIDTFMRKYNIKKNDIASMISKVTSELNNLGWKLKTSFGGTGLFIYSTDTLPPSCYEE
jgi:hypothetical protein